MRRGRADIGVFVLQRLAECGQGGARRDGANLREGPHDFSADLFPGLLTVQCYQGPSGGPCGGLHSSQDLSSLEADVGICVLQQRYQERDGGF